ncbi:MAG: (2Fe-2S)-binding protein [Prevotellaceae bacterium]|jgi:predicted molibdopterin-dependent oxidoreductase YjgC|nr:(2Fe-2S)-binding protein [Prevotellaceae bacterium]
MNITINNREVPVAEGETLIEVARREGFSVPSLCYAANAQHRSSCMVCVVKNCATGQIIPSCSALVSEGMQIETDSEEVRLTRTLSLELLLSDHRADCEAPCRVACPAGFDVAAMNRLYDRERYEEALELLRDSLVIPATLCYICAAPCEKVCRRGDLGSAVAIREVKKELVSKAAAKKIRQPASNGVSVAVIGANPAGLSAAYHLRKQGYEVTVLDKFSSILAPHIPAEQVPADTLSLEVEALKAMGIAFTCSAENPQPDEYRGVVAAVHNNPDPQWVAPATKSKQPARLVLEGRRMAEQLHAALSPDKKATAGQDAKMFNSAYSRFSDSEKRILAAQQLERGNRSACLYCDCDKKVACKLRRYATEYGIKSSRYAKSSICEALKRQAAGEGMWFEQAKCIKCGLCVYNSNNGFTFKNRGFVMQVALPEESVGNVTKNLADLCPTGALTL